MRVFNVENLTAIQARREEENLIPLTIEAMGQQLVQERLKNAQVMAELATALVQTRLELAELKEGK